MNNGIRAFGKERNRVKYMGGKTPFYTRGNIYYVSNLWYKKEVPMKPTKLPTKYSEKERASTKREDEEGKERVRIAHWVRKPKDDCKNHPSYQSLIQKYGQMPGGYWHLDEWKGFVDDRALYGTYFANDDKKLPNITDPAPTGGLRQDPMATD
jgi:hypothetical protein